MSCCATWRLSLVQRDDPGRFDGGRLIPQGWQRAATAISLLWLSTAAGAGMVFAAQTLLARQLGPADYGLFASSLATVTMIAPLAGFGLSQLRLRVYGEEGWGADRWIAPSLRLSLVTGVITCVAVVTWALLVTG